MVTRPTTAQRVLPITTALPSNLLNPSAYPTKCVTHHLLRTQNNNTTTTTTTPPPPPHLPLLPAIHWLVACDRCVNTRHLIRSLAHIVPTCARHIDVSQRSRRFKLTCVTVAYQDNAGAIGVSTVITRADHRHCYSKADTSQIDVSHLALVAVRTTQCQCALNRNPLILTSMCLCGMCLMFAIMVASRHTPAELLQCTIMSSLFTCDKKLLNIDRCL
jgi:hypothetical protein